MLTITLKKIPQELYDRLKLAAEQNHRSLNSEIIACLEQAVYSQPVDVEETLRRARLLREKTAAYRITDDEFTQAKQDGRA